VGDMNFQRKCFNKIKEMRKADISTILVTHNLYSVEGLCDAVLVLDKGKLTRSGNDVTNIVMFYEEGVLDKSVRSAIGQRAVNKRSFENRGTGEINIVYVKIMNQNGKEERKLSVGEEIVFEVEIGSSVDVENPIYSLALVRIDGLVCGVHRTYFDKIIPPKINKGKSRFRFAIINNQLNSGEYFIGIAISDRELAGQLPYCWRQMETFMVINPPAPNVNEGCGVFFPQVRWEFSGQLH